MSKRKKFNQKKKIFRKCAIKIFLKKSIMKIMNDLFYVI